MPGSEPSRHLGCFEGAEVPTTNVPPDGLPPEESAGRHDHHPRRLLVAVFVRLVAALHVGTYIAAGFFRSDEINGSFSPREDPSPETIAHYMR
jgi:hypothetical protein